MTLASTSSAHAAWTVPPPGPVAPSAQTAPTASDEPEPDRRNAIYGELLGSGFIWSINYDRRTDHDLALRLGFGFTNTSLGSGKIAVLALPFTLSKLIGRPGTWLELGLGGTFLYLNVEGTSFGALGPSLGTFETSASESLLLLTGVVGFRLAPPRSRVVIRLTFTPWLASVGDKSGKFKLGPWGGLSLGFGY